MEYLARAVEIALGENIEHDASGFVLSRALWDRAVRESDYVAALDDLRIVFVDDKPGA